MANLTFFGLTGQSLDAIILDQTGGWWNWDTGIFEAYAAISHPAYATPLAEVGSTGVYACQGPNAPNGVYEVLYCRRLGATPAAGDPKVGAETLEWNGHAKCGRPPNFEFLDGDAILADIATLIDLATTRLAAIDYVAPDNQGVADIRAKTDQLTFVGERLAALVGAYAEGQSPREQLADLEVGIAG